MQAITTEQVKELRNRTSISIMQCRKALEEADGDMEKAIVILKKKSSDIALKKGDRLTNEGMIIARADGKKAVVVVLNCETDFVAKNEDFVGLANTLADKAMAEGAEKAKEEAKEMISLIIQKTGENIQLQDISEISGENIGAYVHGGKSCAIVSLSGGDASLSKDIAMHIAAMRPEYTSKDDIDQKTKDMVAEMLKKEVDESDKPEEMKSKILAGKIDGYFKDKILLEQAFIKNGDMKIGDLLKKAGLEVKIDSWKYYSIK